MAACDAIYRNLGISPAKLRSSSNDVMIHVSSSDELPDLIHVQRYSLSILLMELHVPWRSVHGCYSEIHPTANSMLVVAIPLGEEFLDEGCPERTIKANLIKDGASSGQWHVIINDLSERNSK